MANSNNNIEKMYAFIATKITQDDWLQYVDYKYGNNDGNLVKSEFSYFVKQELSEKDFAAFDYQTGYSEANKNDLINKFWQEIDTERGLGRVNGTKLVNQNTLDSNEIDAANEQIQKYRLIAEYVKKAVDTLMPKDIADIGPNAKGTWRTKVTEGLTDAVLKNYNFTEGLGEFLDSILLTVAKRTTADMFAQNYLSKAQNMLAGMGYDRNELAELLFANDEDNCSKIQSMINIYISKINDGSFQDDIKDIRTNVENMIKEYLGTAFPDNSNFLTSTTMISRVNYNPKNIDSLNDIQKFVLRNKFGKQVSAELSQDSTRAPYYSGCEKFYQPIIDKFLDNILQGITNDSYKEYYNGTKTIDITPLFNYPEYKTLMSKIEQIAQKVEQETGNVTLDYKTSDEIQFALSSSGPALKHELDDYTQRISDGNHVYTNLSNTVVKDANGNSLGTLGENITNIISDIAHRKNNSGGTDIINNIIQTVIGNITGNILEKQDVSSMSNANASINYSNIDIKSEAGKQILTLILQNLAEIFKAEGGFPSNLNLENLEKLYFIIVQTAKESGESEDIRDAAIMYCDAIAKKGDIYKNALVEKFGENWNETLSNMSIAEIRNNMTALINDINQIDYLNSSAQTRWSMLLVDTEINTSSSQTLCQGFSAIINDKDGNRIENNRISYIMPENEIVGNAVNIVLDSNKRSISVSSGNVPGTTTANIYAVVDGVVVKNSKQTIKVTSKFNMTTISSNIKYTADADRNNTADDKLVGKSIKDLFSSNEWISIGEGVSQDVMDLARTNAKNGITAFINNLQPKFIAAGLDATQVNNAIMTTINYYTYAIDATWDNQYKTGDADGSFYVLYELGYTGRYEYSYDTYHQTTRYHDQDGRNALGSYMSSQDYSNSCGLGLWEGWNNTDSYGYYVSVAAVLKKFEHFYNYTY